MPEIYIPFTQGQSEAVDKKILPQGLFKSVSNIRYTKDGRMASRFGYDFISGSQGQMIAAGDFNTKRTLYIKERSSSTGPASSYLRTDNSIYQFINPGPGLVQGSGCPSIGTPVRKAAGRNLQYTCVASDIAYSVNNTSQDTIGCVYHDFDPASGTSRGIFFAVFDALSGALKQSVLVDANGRNPKIVSNNSSLFVVVYNAIGADTIKYAKYGSTSGTASGTGTIVTATAGRGWTFDIAPNDSNGFLLIYESAAAILSWGTVDYSTTTFTLKATRAFANPIRPSITLGSSGNVAYCWNEGATFLTGNTHYRVDTIGGVIVTGDTVIYAGGNARGFPVAGKNTTDDFSFAWNFAPNGAITANSLSTFTPSIGTAKSIGCCSVVGKPFMGPNNACYIWAANYSASDDTSQLATYKLIDVESPQARIEGATCELVCCQKQALPGGYLSGATNPEYIDNRRFSVSTSTTIFAPSATAFACCLPIVAGSATGVVQRFGCDIIKVESSTWADRLLPGNINGQLFFSGPRLFEFDGSNFYESGLGNGPEYFALADAGAGAIGAGTYQYMLIYEWTDDAGRRHQSPPSPIKSITIAASHNVTVSFAGPAFSARFSSGKPGIVTSIYRTQAGGTQFFLVNSNKNNVITTTNYDNTIYTYTDSATDATIGVNEKIYTQGDRGGLSGRLENSEPPACKYIWPGNNRLIMGGLEVPSEVQWSKLVFPGEPLCFSDNPAFKARIDGEVTGVASLDGTWYVGSRNSIFSFSGQGPDDKGAGGDFGDPIKLPADIGFYSQRSMVEVPEGLLFQGRYDRIYLLPRGGGAPEWVGQEVRDTLAAYPFIADAQLIPDENVVYFACMNTAGTNGRILVYDTRIKQWYVDILFGDFAGTTCTFRCLNIYNGKIVLDGRISETSAWEDDEDGAHSRTIQISCTMGDIRPFGLTGWGRIRKLTFLGEARDVVTDGILFLTIPNSDNAAVQDLPFWTLSTVAGGTGDTFEIEHMVTYPKRDAIAPTFGFVPNNPSEGVVFNGLSLEVYPESGLRRLPGANRQ